MKKTSKNMTMGMSLGMCFGVALGTSFGGLFGGSIAIGTSMGLCIGMLVGLAIGSAKDKIVNAQIEEEGYTIKIIEKDNESAEYKITIVNNKRKEIVVTVPSGTMETELFTVGDIVFMDEGGDIEQAFDKDYE